MKKEKSVTLTLNKEMFFSVLLHHVWKKHPVNVDFLGIYIPPTNKFSPSVHGLLGKHLNHGHAGTDFDNYIISWEGGGR